MPQANDRPQATRVTSGQILNVIARNIPGLIGGSADLTPSTNTALEGEEPALPGRRASKYIEYGIRELAMQGIANGIQGYGLPGIVPYVSTFFVFVQYILPALRVAAFDNLRVLAVLTHDSIGLGEDGPTHQNVENFAVVRALPRCLLFRPADTVETSAAYTAALTGPSRPAVFAFSRQTAPNIDGSSFDGALKGGYVVRDVPKPDVIFIGTGTELSLAIEAAAVLGLPARIVSFPCIELFDEQALEYRMAVLPPGIPIVSVEAGVSFGWSKYSHKHFGVEDYGMSAPAPLVYEHFGLTPEKVAEKTKAVIQFYKTHQIPDLLQTP
jgi:transketolase